MIHELATCRAVIKDIEMRNVSYNNTGEPKQRFDIGGLVYRLNASYLSVYEDTLNYDTGFANSGYISDDFVAYALNNNILSIERTGTNIAVGSYKDKCKKVTKTNYGNVRYYYNIDKIMEQVLADSITGMGTEVDPYMINTPEQMMVYSLMFYMTTTGIRTPYLSVAYETGFRDRMHYRLGGDIDLSTYSFYSIATGVNLYLDGGGHRITLDAKGIDEVATVNTESTMLYANHHKEIHGSLYKSISNSGYIRNLTITGNVATYGDNGQSGALVGIANGGNGTNYKISNITMRDLYLYGAKDSRSVEADVDYSKAERGLLIGEIKKNTALTFDEIIMRGYSTPTFPGNDKEHVASALIGTMGADSGSTINLRFTNLDLADVIDGSSIDEARYTGATIDDVLHDRTILGRASVAVKYSAIVSPKYRSGYNFYYEDYVKGLEMRVPKSILSNDRICNG